ncbi:MAG: DUF1838 family protein [Rhodospirillaceae bacterium]|nr:DUF1838 family protein [Rhodospirillaceae bacterium]
MTHANEFSISRRSAMAGLAAGALAAPAPTPAEAAPGADAWMSTPKGILDTYIRVQGDLTGKVCPWRWHGYMVAVTPTENPKVLFACEGVETKKVFVRETGFEMWSKVMTIFKDPDSGEVLNGKTWKNPFTGAMNTVKPNIVGSKTLYTVSDTGTILGAKVGDEPNPFLKDQAGAKPTAPPPPKSAPDEMKLQFIVLGDKVQIAGQRKYPDKRPIPLAEFGTTTAELADIRDTKKPRVEAVFAAAFLAPWQGFLEMPTQPGHAVWHAVGRKMEGFEGLSPEYLAQAKIHIPDVLAWAEM